MRQFGALGLAFALSCLGAVGLSGLGSRRYSPPFPPLAESLSSPAAQLSDFVGIALGFRRLTADIAWIQTVLYYGTTEEGADAEESENGGGRYPLFLAYCQRVVQIDPTFIYAYYYGAGALGWNLNRLDEAETLLKDGIRTHPKEWRFQQYLAGLAFQKSHNINKLTEFLKAFVAEENCPNLLRSILANIYKRQKRYHEAVEVWLLVYQTQDPTYLQRAVSQIRELGPLAHKSQPNRP